MNETTPRPRRGIFVVGGVLGALLILFLLFRTPGGTGAKQGKPGPPTAPAVKLVSLRRNEAALTDPTPLFLPTEWNAGQNALPASAQREPGGSFQGYPAKLAFAEEGLSLSFPTEVVIPSGPADALASDRLGQSFPGVGRTDQVISQLSNRKAFIEIQAAGSGQRILTQALADANPPGGSGWWPLEFLVAVDAMGLVGPPMLTESSRVSMVDAYFQNYLVKTLHAGERLAPGYYRICIGP